MTVQPALRRDLLDRPPEPWAFLQKNRSPLGVTARPLRSQREESLARDELAVRIQPSCLAFDALLLEVIPMAANPHAAKIQHGLRPAQLPVPTGSLHATFHQGTAGTFDHPAGH